MSFILYNDDCLTRLKQLEENSIDSIVTDPPYGLSFMGKKWDYDVPSEEIWAECLRVLKPGGHLLAFAGTRTQHRMAVRIEDAGFEIRDMIAWVYSQGFPKSHNLDNLRGDKICGCSQPYTQNGAKQKTECNVRPVRESDVSSSINNGSERCEVLQSSVQKQSASTHGEKNCSGKHEGCEQSCVEGRSYPQETPRELCSSSICSSACMGITDDTQGRLCNGASSSNGENVRLSADANGGGSSCGPQSAEQCERQSGTVAGQPEPQTMGAWPICGGCGLPILPIGFGTSLKPALEPVTVARKPLGGRTVAENVLAHGTGALNIDGCRVGDEPITQHGRNGDAFGFTSAEPAGRAWTGRWPANLIHDGGDEVVGLFPADKQGSAARFFYAPKASKRDRDEGLDLFEVKQAAGLPMRSADGERGGEGLDGTKTDRLTVRKNIHPTVKPTDLMRYLCRLVTPPNGVVLDPFMGSGSTGKAAMLEGFQFIGIEREAEYVEIAKARIQHALDNQEKEQQTDQMSLL